MQLKAINNRHLKTAFYYGATLLLCFFSSVNNGFSASLSIARLNSHIWLGLAVCGGIVISAAIVCFFLIRRIVRFSLYAHDNGQSATLQQIGNYERLLAHTGQCAVIWNTPLAQPIIVGRLTVLDNMGVGSQNVLRFGQWLHENELRILDDAITDLRQEAQGFELYLETKTGALIEVNGVIAGTAAIVRFQDLSEREQQTARMQKDTAAMRDMLELRNTLLNALAEPVWLTNHEGRIIYANQAFHDASGYQPEKPDNASFFNEATRARLADSKPLFKGPAYAIAQGERRLFDVTQITTDKGEATFAHDVSALENLSDEMKRMMRAHSETLDQISTAVAIFGADQKLKFANQAFAMLWPLDTVFLESEPSHTLLLDRLREEGIIAEKPDWRGWKDELFSAYRSGEPSQQIWNLPDGRTLRVLASPHPQGGVTWLFENLTEKINLERRYNTLIEMQGETLDHLSEGVAVFGPDGRVRLSNPALARLWSLPQELMVEGTHIAKLQAECAPQTKSDAWSTFSAFITGFTETRDAISGRMDLLNGIVLDYALVPLPNSQTMMTFVNVTDTVNVTRALQEKNEALTSADRLRSEFVRHVSYELRTPLTNIMGFSDVLRNELYGPLNPRQHEYLEHISTESDALLNIVNDILDLAKLDAGIMELDIQQVDIADAMNYATERTKERLGERPVVIEEKIDSGLTAFSADPLRLRQIFVSVLSNAANFAPDHSVIEFVAQKQGNEIVFSVHDHGCGIPEDILDTVFKRFSSHAHHGSRAGAGLGLSIVKSFVELHGGTVAIKTGEGQGTTVLCSFPISRVPAAS